MFGFTNPEAWAMKQVQHIQDVFLLSGFTNPTLVILLNRCKKHWCDNSTKNLPIQQWAGTNKRGSVCSIWPTADMQDFWRQITNKGQTITQLWRMKTYKPGFKQHNTAVKVGRKAAKEKTNNKEFTQLSELMHKLISLISHVYIFLSLCSCSIQHAQEQVSCAAWVVMAMYSSKNGTSHPTLKTELKLAL